MTFLDTMRQKLIDTVKTHPSRPNLRGLSLALGRNPAYLQQFIHRGSPRILPEPLRHHLATLLGIDERQLRQEDNLAKETASDIDASPLLSISFLDHPSQKKARTQPWLIPQVLFEDHNPDQPSSFRLAVIGDSIANTCIQIGDVVMLDLSDRSPHRAGYFGLDGGDHIRVRHIEAIANRSPSSMYIRDDDAENGYMVEENSVDIIGRMIFHSRVMVASL